MDLKKHYLFTVTALFFLGILVAKPGASFAPSEKIRDCQWSKGKLQCEYKDLEYQINYPAIKYRFK